MVAQASYSCVLQFGLQRSSTTHVFSDVLDEDNVVVVTVVVVTVVVDVHESHITGHESRTLLLSVDWHSSGS